MKALIIFLACTWLLIAVEVGYMIGYYVWHPVAL